MTTMAELGEIAGRLIGPSPVRVSRGDNAHVSRRLDMSRKQSVENVTGNGASGEDVARMTERLAELEAENLALKAGQSALKVVFHPKGEKCGKDKQFTRKSDVWTASGGRMGYPETHSERKWLGLQAEVDNVIKLIQEGKAK